jgi:sugar lactone lactonase YvrE
MKTPNKRLALVTLLLIMTYGASSTLAQTVKTARFLRPEGLALDSKGNLYVVDSGHGQIRKITPDGSVSSLAGGAPDRGGPDGRNTDGTGNEARFENPHYIAIDGADNLYVTALYGDRIRKISPAGVVSTVTKETREVCGIAVDSAGNIYFAGLGMIRKITSDGVVETLAGKLGSGEKSVDGTGSAARFGSPGGVALDSANNVYVTDGYTIRKITPAGVVTTIAGMSSKHGYVDGTGSAARFYGPTYIAVDNANNLYVSDQGTIRKITPDGVVSTVAGKPGLTIFDGGFKRPSGLAVDKAGNIYVGDSDVQVIRKITAAGVASTLAGKLGISDEEQERAIQEDENRRHGR